MHATAGANMAGRLGLFILVDGWCGELVIVLQHRALKIKHVSVLCCTFNRGVTFAATTEAAEVAQ